MSSGLLLQETDGAILTLTINRPEHRNALNPEVLGELSDTLRSLPGTTGVRVVVVRGAGDQAFSSGFDLGKTSPRPRGAGDPLEIGFTAIEACPLPVIAMIGGFCVGAGLELALACDIRVAADTARFGQTAAKLGLIYRHEGIRRVVRHVGAARARDLFFTARLHQAQRAYEIGLVDYVVPVADLASATYGLARELCDNAPLSISGTKAIIARLAGAEELGAADLAAITAVRQKALESEDVQEGRRAFAEKRKPRFQGK